MIEKKWWKRQGSVRDFGVLHSCDCPSYSFEWLWDRFAFWAAFRASGCGKIAVRWPVDDTDIVLVLQRKYHQVKNLLIKSASDTCLTSTFACWAQLRPSWDRTRALGSVRYGSPMGESESGTPLPVNVWRTIPELHWIWWWSDQGLSLSATVYEEQKDFFSVPIRPYNELLPHYKLAGKNSQEGVCRYEYDGSEGELDKCQPSRFVAKILPEVPNKQIWANEKENQWKVRDKNILHLLLRGMNSARRTSWLWAGWTINYRRGVRWYSSTSSEKCRWISRVSGCPLLNGGLIDLRERHFLAAFCVYVEDERRWKVHWLFRADCS